MDKVFKWIFGVSGLLLLLLAALWGVSKLVGPSRAERDALGVMSVSEKPQGRNAYADLWLADHDVPVAGRDALLAADVAAFAATPISEEGKPVPFVSGVEARYRNDAPDQAGSKLLCSPREDCLAKVRADLPAYKKLAATHAAWFARRAEATRADHLANPFPSRIDMPFLSFGTAYAPATTLALQFAKGDREAALAGTCSRLADWRRLGARTDMLISWAVGHAYAGRGYASLLAQMLAEWPNDAPLPASCEAALALPGKEETTMCPAVRGEYRFTSEGVATMLTEQARRKGVQEKLLFDPDMTRAQMAAPLARFCTAEADALFARDEPLPPFEPASMVRLQCVSNAVGCILGKVAEPGFDTYAARHRDYLAVMRTLAALAWWRGQPDALGDPAAVLHRLPAAYRSSSRVLRVEQQPWVRQVMTPQGPRALTSRVPVLRVPTPASQEALPVLPLPGSRLTPATP